MTGPDQSSRRDDGPSEMKAPEPDEQVSVGTSSPAATTPCRVWYQAGGCVLERRHTGPHRSPGQIEIGRLTAELAAERERNAPLRARIKALQDQHDADTAGLKAKVARLEQGNESWERISRDSYVRWKAERQRADQAEAEHADCSNLSHAEEARQMRAERDEWKALALASEGVLVDAPALALHERERAEAALAENAALRAAGDALAEAIEAGLGYVPMKRAADAWRALGTVADALLRSASAF